MNMKHELQAKFDSRKSFYGKAIVKELDNGNKLLISYGTEVAAIINNKIVKLWGGYSQTTMRHISEFVRQETGDIINKKYWDSIPLERV